ncbi:YitT family protein [uncultured Clostridium sp.]|uniref:YitT family protein n=1 Tax=uncultured Clostridium sp. TaxID=59620 RepID=UPI0026223194|nr:YitT family protein [uncultured Clostridium sp.]
MNNSVLKRYMFITIGVTLLAIALQFFYYPNNIAAGGVSGLALIINTHTGLSTGLVMNLCNVVLFTLAFIFIGKEFAARSIYAAFGTSFALSILEKLFPNVSITSDPILAVICGSALAALGIAMVFDQNSSTGGTAIIAKLLNKYCKLNIGKALLLADIVVVGLAVYTFGIEKGLYGVVSCFILGFMIDKIIEGFNDCKQLIIITSKYEDLRKFILNSVDRGCTKIIGKGAYSSEDVTILYVVVSRKEFIVLKNQIKQIDPKAFITVSDVKEVLGEGFSDLIEK